MFNNSFISDIYGFISGIFNYCDFIAGKFRSGITNSCISDLGISNWRMGLGMVLAVGFGLGAVCEGVGAEKPVGYWDLSVFEGVKVPGTELVADFETVWEMNLAGTEWDADAYENNHNFFVYGNIAYVFVEKYGSDGSHFVVKQVNITSGEIISEDNIDWAFEKVGTYKRILTIDDAGNLTAISVMSNPAPVSKSVKFHLIVNQVDLENKSIICRADYKLLEEQSAGTVADASEHRFAGMLEVKGITGDCSTGVFNVAIDSWKANTVTNKNVHSFLPTRCIYSFTNDSKVPSYERIVFTDENLDGYCEVKSDKLTPSDGINAFFAAEQVADGRFLVQKFLDPRMILFSSKGEKYVSYFSPKPDWYSMDAVVADESRSAQCRYGAKFVNLGGHDFLIVPATFAGEDSQNGTTFRLVRWADNSSLEKLETLLTFPAMASDGSPKFGKPSQHYNTVRPFVSIVKAGENAVLSADDSNADTPNAAENSQATVLVYMPGSGLGAYKLSIRNNGPVSGVATLREADAATFSLNGRELSFASLMQGDYRCRVFSPSGALVSVNAIIAAGDGDMATVGLDDVPAGMYVVSLADAAGNSRMAPFRIALR